MSSKSIRKIRFCFVQKTSLRIRELKLLYKKKLVNCSIVNIRYYW